MDFLVELVVQLVVQVVVELLYELLLRFAWTAAANLVRTLVSSFVLSFLAGLGFGVAWGHYLAGNQTWPKLFWVSVALGVAAFVLAMTRGERVGRPQEGLRRGELLAPPWRWSSERLVGFALINAGLAVGIGLAFGPSWTPAA